MIKEIHKENHQLICQYLEKFGKVNPTYETYDHYYVYMKNDQPIALSYFQVFYERAELLYLYVNESYRNQNYGKILLEQGLEKLKDLGVKEVSLEVNIENKYALHLYEHNGFTVVRVIPKYYKGKDGYLMYRKL